MINKLVADNREFFPEKCREIYSEKNIRNFVGDYAEKKLVEALEMPINFDYEMWLYCAIKNFVFDTFWKYDQNEYDSIKFVCLMITQETIKNF